ncbi:hypothetical protein BVG79_00987 [Ketogulonicigenium robustum]|uniref:DUF2141 domain-containing protein n=1 Tax=Ketogulonicigenium robustum TaxID=92947 RepID=A0A1W6NYL0_9RHOB|nr:hypothetical protein [Ketogulonicigenium robustum]ARO14335.1 hypothetical protein BVG79_00987 [Ketogulonicigenium robustum]
MNILKTLGIALLVGSFATIAAADIDFSQSGMAVTEGGHAYAKVKKADRVDGVLHVEIEFVTDYQGYSGETLYQALAEGAIFIRAGDATYPPIDSAAVPDKLQLTFNYNPEASARVGRWKADFVAPASDAAELVMPGIAPIPLAIRDR